MMPKDNRELADKAVELIEKSSSFAGMLNDDVALSVGNLVRSMNCYYSNLIEGHGTHPRDIERAMHDDFDASDEKRDLQKEAKAHIEVQGFIDRGEVPYQALSKAFALWIHKEFCDRLPSRMLWVKNPDTGEKSPVIPGEFRETFVQVGRHIAPKHEDIEKHLARLEEAYDPARHTRVRQVISVAAAHHRFVWVHPFLDGNGRVTRLMSHAYLKQLDIGSSLWSVSRGLAKKATDYKRLLAAADEQRHGDFDGRGVLSERTLTEFCDFFLDACIDQVDFMSQKLELKGLQARIERYCMNEIDAKRLLPGSGNLLREALLSGEFKRGRAGELTGKGDVQARKILAKLTEKGLLVSDTPKGAVRLDFPLDALEHWMPGLY
ncbi:MAG: Fic family protein [Ghiorsea sp.]|nr:Fic family protein [Ghiorsea sp.]